ncbi:Icc protein [Nitrospirillum amazonense]|uniref:Icc protein n=1 Tax=Nitrospirillum amazonense TaxID=28077 RepID=A0A560FKF6_9PROT|nr:metallophosphoesterase [Nitrospirillum amazonense]TWB22093.1 Icc protein [Nitrospirillum amazonense]
MTATVIAHITDTHLGQRLAGGGAMAGDKMRYVADPGAHKAHLRRILDDIARKGITDVVFGGDIGTDAAVPAFFDAMHDHGFTPLIVLGNHDSHASVAPYCEADGVAGKLCSSTDVGGWRRITLDSSDNLIGEAQLAWLAGALEGARRAVIFVHHPILEMGTPIDHSGAALRDRAALQSLLSGATCEVTVFCGHYHMIDERCEANIRQFVTPAVSYQVVKHADEIRLDTGTFGYRIIEFDCAEIRTQVVLMSDPAGPHDFAGRAGSGT